MSEDAICGGGVGIVLARMDSHPEEFWMGEDKWKFIYQDYFRDSMNETEKGMIFDKLKKIRQEEFNQRVLATLVPPQEEEEEDSPSRFARETTLGRAQIKREGRGVTYK